MKQVLITLFFGERVDTKPYKAISGHTMIIKAVWKGEKYNDIGLERLFRLFLLAVKFIFPGLYIDHLSGKMGGDVRSFVSELYVLAKVIFPFIILVQGLSSNPFFLYFNLYLLIETFVAVFNRIYLSEHFEPEGYKRMLLLLFLNFLEVVLSFAVFYDSGPLMRAPFHNHWDAIYFSMMTSSTIAYGDNYPVTDAGRIIATMQALTTLVFLGLFFNFFNNRLKD